MITRYNLLKASKAIDIDNDEFPDPLSLNYREILKTFFIPPLQIDIDENFIDLPYLLIYSYYSTKENIVCSDEKGQVFLDDIILDLNNVKHKDALNDGDKIVFPDSSELSSFINSNISKKE